MHSDLIVFGENWGRQATGAHHLVRHLGTERKVVWVNSPVLQCCTNCLHGQAQPSDMGDYRPDRILAPLAPLMRHFPSNAASRADKQQLLGHQIRTAMSMLELRRPILLTSVPTAVDAVGELDEHAVVYYCDTDFTLMSDVACCPTIAMECELAGRADLIIAATPELARRFPCHRTVFIDQDDQADGSWTARAATVGRLLDQLA